MPSPAPSPDPIDARLGRLFHDMVESVGVKRFASAMGLSTRQVNRMLAGAQPNPLERILRCIQAASSDSGDRALDALCQEAGGYFIRHEGDEESSADRAVKEAAEAIAAISDGHVSEHDEREIREAIAALIALTRSRKTGGQDHPAR